MRTCTWIGVPPGWTVSVVPRLTSSAGAILTVALAPAARWPDKGETVSEPSRLDCEIDQFTGPPCAVRVIVLPASGPPSGIVSSTVAGETVSVPAFGGGGELDGDGVGDGPGCGALPLVLARGVVAPGPLVTDPEAGYVTASAEPAAGA